jgi:hypothetical protein
MGLKWDIEKFTGSNDFGLWKVNMMTLLIQNKCVKALKGEPQISAHLTPAEKYEINDKAINAIILCLGDKVFREVAKETTNMVMWTKLDSLYTTKLLTHRQCLKQNSTFIEW